MKRSTIVIAGIVALVIVVGALAMMKHPSTQPASTSTSPAASTATDNSKQAAAVITYGSSGFSPDLTTVKSGETVTFENKTSEEIQVDSNPHPIHTDDTDLNVGSIAAGQSKTVTLTKMGTFGFHNHFDPGDTAKITIQ
jgi:plastocyanin